MSPDLFYIQILSVGLLGLAAHYGSRITRHLGIGEVVGQVLGGLLVGPILLFFIERHVPAYREALRSLHFFTFLFLSLIAFGIGDEFNIEKIKRVGRKVVTLTMIEGCVTWILVTGTFFLLGFKPVVALIIGSIGIATAPAATFAIMNRLNIGGNMRTLLGGMVVFDDLFEIFIFSVVCQAALSLQGASHVNWGGLILPVGKEFAFALLLGLGVFFLVRLGVERRWLQPKDKKYGAGAVPGPEFLSRLISEMPGPSVNVFMVVTGCLSLGVGFALHWRLPFLITAVSAGILISNLYSREVFHSLNIQSATSMFTLAFFALIGANADLSAFHVENFVYIAAYVLARGAGKIGGTWLGCRITGQEKELRQTLPKLMLPQAGVAAVEAFYVATVLGNDGKMVLEIIIPGLIIFEVIGVLTSERALLKWRAFVMGMSEIVDEETLIRKSIEKGKIALSSLIHPECLRVPLQVSSKGEAIWELVHTLHAAGMIHNPGQALNIIMERERQGGITLENGIAIPHGRIPDMEKPAVALGIFPEDQPVPCGGPGDQPTEVMYLVLSPNEPPELHLQVLAAIASFFANKEAWTLLRRAKNHMEAIDIIHKYSKK